MSLQLYWHTMSDTPGVFLGKRTGEGVLVHKVFKDQTCLPELRGHPEDGVVWVDPVPRPKDLALGHPLPQEGACDVADHSNTVCWHKLGIWEWEEKYPWWFLSPGTCIHPGDVADIMGWQHDTQVLKVKFLTTLSRCSLSTLGGKFFQSFMMVLNNKTYDGICLSITCYSPFTP